MDAEKREFVDFNNLGNVVLQSTHLEEFAQEKLNAIACNFKDCHHVFIGTFPLFV